MSHSHPNGLSVMATAPQQSYSPSASSCQSQAGSIMGDVGEGSHLITHGDHSPKTMVDTPNIHLSMGQSQSHSCKNELNEDVDVTLAQFPNAVKMEDVTDDMGNGDPSSTTHHYLASSQHQNLMNVTTATLNAANDFSQQVHHSHHHLGTTDRGMGEPTVLYGMYS